MIERISPKRFVHPTNDLHRRKLRALDNFIEGLLSQPGRHQLGRIILFGSALEGDITAESDVDLLVLGTGDLQTLRRACAVAAFETNLATGERVEPLVFPLSYYYHPASPFIHRLRQRGKEILSELINRFGDLYARTGKVPPQMGRDLHMALEIRARARYVEEAVINQADAEGVIALAEALLERLIQLEQEQELES